MQYPRGVNNLGPRSRPRVANDALEPGFKDNNATVFSARQKQPQGEQELRVSRGVKVSTKVGSRLDNGN